MKKNVLTAMCMAFLLVAVSVPCSLAVKATTEDGREVELHQDGTWEFRNGPGEKMARKVKSQYQKPESSKKLLEGKKVKYGIWYDAKSWIINTRPNNQSAEYELKLTEGDLYAMIIPERIQIPLETLKNAALENARKVAPDAKITFEEKRVVNGVEVLCVRIDATLQGIPFLYYNYYWAGDSGSVQVVTYTGQSLFKTYKSKMEDLLNGFVVFE